ncbi:MAG: GIY-YIG nuclease family protein [Chloroflexota bacterium]|nr:MAG: GIY-YIG nuclease family protein [Chloroflexota bacterium]
MAYHVYLLLCADGTYYTGYTGDLTRRFKQHQTGAIPRAYTKSRRPVKLVWVNEFDSKEAARTQEKKIKRWTAEKKETLILADQAQTEQAIRELDLND